MSDLREAYEKKNKPIDKKEITNGFVHVPDENAVARVWGGDRRLSLFSYSIETINMLLMPMFEIR